MLCARLLSTYSFLPLIGIWDPFPLEGVVLYYLETWGFNEGLVRLLVCYEGHIYTVYAFPMTMVGRLGGFC